MSQRLTAHLHELVLAMDRVADHLLSTRFGIDHNLFVFLNPLLDGALDVTRMAERLNLTKAAVSKRVPRLEGEGWLETSTDPGHGRRVLVSLTPKGRDLIVEANALLAERFAAIMNNLSIDSARLDADLQAMIPAVRASTEGELR